MPFYLQRTTRTSTCLQARRGHYTTNNRAAIRETRESAKTATNCASQGLTP